jgi:hypothetical protein
MPRQKPVQRDEVYFDRTITTLPIDSVRKVKYSGRWLRYEPIPRLWAPLLQALNQERKQQWGDDCRPVEAPGFTDGTVYKCWHCRGKFYKAFGAARHVYCSDQCAKAARSKTFTKLSKARSKARAEARAGRKCESCGKAIRAQRSTARFCSVRCRVASHRANHHS